MTTQWARDVQGDIVLPSIGHGADAIERDYATCAKIKVQAGLDFVQGEWFLDTLRGFPWFFWLGQKSPDLVGFRHALGRYILSIPPVARVDDLAVTEDRPLRNTGYSFTAHIGQGLTVSVP